MKEKQDFKEKVKKIDKQNKEKAKKAIENYKKFAIKGNAMDLAVGVVLGSAFTNIVNTIVSSVITPSLSLLTSKVDLSTLFITLRGGKFDTLEQAKAAGAITLNYGELINAVLNFVIVSIVLFIIVSIIKNSTAKKAVENKEKTTKSCPYCLSEIPIKATKCAHCTSDLETTKNENTTENKINTTKKDKNTKKND